MLRYAWSQTVIHRTRSNKSEVVRNALDAYLAQEMAPQKGSVLKFAGDLAGTLEGSADLFHHDEHIRGYGE